MLVLHLSDLHLTGENKTFDDVWHGPANVIGGLGEKPFDSIVVSGDLSQRADPGEYKVLAKFAREALLPLLKVEDVARIIFVPGNHDVSWGTSLGNPVELKTIRAKYKSVAGFVRKEGTLDSRYRHSVGDGGRVDVVEINEKAYAKRMAAVQKFLLGFYGRAEPPQRIFELTNSAPREHWSAHVFAEDGVAFYGFNSCHRNDRHWTGAGISSAAVAAAREHAQKHANGLLRIAVWHHGFGTQQGRPDYLSPAALGLLYNAGFRVGMHGHTHKAAVDVHRYLSDRFVVVATGSIGAGAEERPDAVANQFSVLRILPSQVRVETYDRDGGTHVYGKPARRLFLLRAGDEPDEHEPSTADEHRRTWRVNVRDGLADVTVELRKLEMRGPLPLAIVTPPHGALVAESNATTSTYDLKVTRTSLPGNRAKFVLDGTRGHYDHCSWHYSIANAFALTRRDARCMPDRANIPRLGADEEGRSHTVRFPCERISLTFEFVARTDDEVDPHIVCPDTGRVIVERLVIEHGEERWVNVPDEATRCASAITVTSNRVVFELDAPLVGCRYTPAFRLKEAGVAPARGATLAAEQILERCRTQTDPDTGRNRAFPIFLSLQHSRMQRSDVETTANKIARDLRDLELKQSIADYFAAALESPLRDIMSSTPFEQEWLGAASAWVAMLWNEERGLLFPAFGRFSSATWTARFPWGVGVAGQAFRFAAPAAWYRGDRSSLIYQDRTETGGHFLHEYKWIVAVPIAVPNGAPVGIVSFAGTDDKSHAAAKLYTTAQELKGKGADARDFLQNLQSLVTAFFWRAVAERDDIPRQHRDCAARIVGELTQGPEGPPSAPPPPAPQLLIEPAPK